MRNPFIQIICNRGNFTKEMNRPFEFAKELLRYCKGEASSVERESMEGILSQVKGLNELAGELKDKKRIEEELRVVESFDVAKALICLKKNQRGRKRLLFSWIAAASIVIIAGISTFWLLNREMNIMNLPMARRNDSGKATVILEMASGLKYRLDTLSSVVCNNRENVSFNNNGGLLKVKKQESADKDFMEEIGYNTINVPYGGTYTVELSDGTRVYLNSGTVLEFPSRFDGDVRSVSLRGEAYFEVARNEYKPFIVEVDGMRVKVLGTSFNVKSYIDEPRVYTTLVQGSVVILRNGQPEKKIVPGEQACYDKENETLRVSMVNVSEFTAWKDGIFYFKDIALEEILRIVARWYDLEIFYMNQEVRKIVYSGKLPMYSSVEDILRKFEMSGDVCFELKGRTLTVYDK